MNEGNIVRAGSMRRFTIAVAALVGLLATACFQDFDFNADHKADYVVVEDNTWTDLATGRVIYTSDDDQTVEDWPVPGDWDGDGFAEAAVVRPNGDWDTGDALGTFSFPKPAELPGFEAGFSFQRLPVPADYDGDGALDAAWYRESDATWFIQGEAPVQFGSGPTQPPSPWDSRSIADEYDYDFPVPADYDGDGKADLSTFNPRTSDWIVRSSSDGTVSTVTMAGNERLAMPVPADYDGVGHAQRAVYGHNGWFIDGHSGPDLFGANSPTSWGGYPAVADYDGDDRADLSYVDTNSGTWHTKGSAQTFQVDDIQFGHWPVATGYSLRSNFARLTYLGECLTEPHHC